MTSVAGSGTGAGDAGPSGECPLVFVLYPCSV
jgi:hypothetical protein